MFKNTINKLFIILLVISIILLPVITSATETPKIEKNKNHIKLAANADTLLNDENLDDDEDDFVDDEEDNTSENEENNTIENNNSESEENNVDENQVILENSEENDNLENSDSQNDATEHGDLYLCENSVTIDYTVDGNLYIIANNVTIDSQIIGDAFIVANSITIGENAYIYNNLFSCSRKLDMKGVAYQVYSICQTADIISAYIDRDFKISCDTLNLQSDIGRDAFISCKSMILENVEAESYTTIGGNLTYSAKDELQIPDYIVAGEIKFTPNVFDTDKVNTSDYILSVITALCFVSLVWLCLLWLSPKFLSSSTQLLKNKKGLITITSICALILIPIVSILFIITNVLSSFAILLMTLYFIIIALGTVISTIVIGYCICNKFNINKKIAIWGILLLVRLALWFITLIPFIGSFIGFIITLLGMGILLAYVLPINKSKKNNSNNIISETY